MSLRSRVTTLVLLSAGMAAAAGAQSSATGTITAHATVGAVVTLSNPTPVEFGTLLAGQTSTHVPPAFSSGSAHAGSIQVDYSDPIDVNVTIDPGGELTNQTTKLTTSLACGFGESATDANAISVACTAQHFSAPTDRTAHTAWIFVGGTTTAPAGAPSGLYSGVVTVRVAVTAS